MLQSRAWGALICQLIVTVQAQDYYSNITIAPDSVSSSLRLEWCQSQIYTCPAICDSTASVNSCDPDALAYDCSCSNGLQPNISSYQQTLPYYECLQWQQDCVSANSNDLTAQNGCLSVVCGNLNATTGEPVTTSGTAAYATVTLTVVQTVALLTVTESPSPTANSTSSGAVTSTETTLGSDSALTQGAGSTSSSATQATTIPSIELPAPKKAKTNTVAIAVPVAIVGPLILGLVAFFVYRCGMQRGSGPIGSKGQSGDQEEQKLGFFERIRSGRRQQTEPVEMPVEEKVHELPTKDNVHQLEEQIRAGELEGAQVHELPATREA